MDLEGGVADGGLLGVPLLLIMAPLLKEEFLDSVLWLLVAACEIVPDFLSCDDYCPFFKTSNWSVASYIFFSYNLALFCHCSLSTRRPFNFSSLTPAGLRGSEVLHLVISFCIAMAKRLSSSRGMRSTSPALRLLYSEKFPTLLVERAEGVLDCMFSSLKDLMLVWVGKCAVTFLFLYLWLTPND